MWAFIPKLLSFLPFLGGLFEKWTENKSRAAELRAEKDLVEAKAFKAGRISPQYLLRYVVVILFMVFGVVIIVQVFVSGDVSAPLEALKHLMTEGGKILQDGEW